LLAKQNFHTKFWSQKGSPCPARWSRGRHCPSLNSPSWSVVEAISSSAMSS
jgi:hypothetical protein